MSRFLFGASLALVTLAPSAIAQVISVPPPSADHEPTTDQIISVSPFFALLGFYTADIERRVLSNATLGIGGSVFSLGPFGYRSVDVKARLYPEGRALEGWGVGASAGLIRLSAEEGGMFSSESSGSGIVVGTDATYTRLVGKGKHLAFSVGGGVKRILRYGGYDVSSVQLTYPTVRASVGFAF